MFDLLKLHGVDLLIVIILVISIIILLIFKDKPKVMTIIKALAKAAEDMLGDGTGEFKFALVVEWLYPKLPRIIKFFLPYSLLVKWIEDGVVEFKKDLQKVQEKIRQKEEQAKLTG